MPSPGPATRERNDADGAVTVTAYRDGPLLVRGPFTLVNSRGEPIERRRRTIALCRCGGSQIKPFCDGTHKLRGFRSDGGAPAPADSESG